MKKRRFGLEIESAIIPTKTYGFDVVHDASVETSVLTSGDNLIIPRSKDCMKKIHSIFLSSYIGGEILTPPLEELNWKVEEIIKNIIVSSRCSLHIHLEVNEGDILSFSKKVLKCGTHFEHFFFRIGGMGRELRGNKEYIFSRPITNGGPQFVRVAAGKYCPSFVINDLFDAVNNYDFMVKFGGTAWYNRRYNPVRYCWLNLYNIWSGRQDTVELRILNSTNNPDNVYFAIEIFREFIEFSQEISMDDSLPENSAFDFLSEKEDIFLLHELTKNQELRKIGERIIRNSTFRTPYKNIYTHLRNPPTIFPCEGYVPPLIAGKVRRPRTSLHRDDANSLLSIY